MVLSKALAKIPTDCGDSMNAFSCFEQLTGAPSVSVKTLQGQPVSFTEDKLEGENIF